MSNKMALDALTAVIEWDARRGYIAPYKVRDPIHAAIAALQAEPQWRPIETLRSMMGYVLVYHPAHTVTGGINRPMTISAYVGTHPSDYKTTGTPTGCHCPPLQRTEP